MEVTALIVFALLMLFAVLGLGAYATVKAVGAAKRGVDRTLAEARRTVEDTTLKARSLGQVGVGGSLAQLRLDLRTSMRATQTALEEGARQDASLRESLSLFARVSAHGHELDEELRRLERDPDKSRVSQALPELRERTAQLTRAADSLRWAARDRARQFADQDLAHLMTEVEMESGALRDWSRPAHEGPATGTAQGSPAVGEARGTSAPGPAHTGAEGTPAAAQPALDAPGAQWNTPYPWQKTPRPEGTV
ncbi:hypothetical protein [Streptomyces sp. NPDC097619]|uniref:hypothetical protein n=1 Tax=Streptomyces sp. NPDC097619 TaxID=3157228 RepID=UPI003324833B